MSAAIDPPVEVVITIAEQHRSSIDAVAGRLKAAGLKNPQTLKSAGLITGTASAKKFSQLRGVNGVEAVEAAGTVQLAPPNSPIQ